MTNKQSFLNYTYLFIAKTYPSRFGSEAPPCCCHFHSRPHSRHRLISYSESISPVWFSALVLCFLRPRREGRTNMRPPSLPASRRLKRSKLISLLFLRKRNLKLIAEVEYSRGARGGTTKLTSTAKWLRTFTLDPSAKSGWASPCISKLHSLSPSDCMLALSNEILASNCMSDSNSWALTTVR